MSGRGPMEGLPDFQNARMVFVYRNSAKWTRGWEPVDDPVGQVDPVSLDPTAKVGPGMAFGDRMSALNPGVEIGLVPCARGSVGIEAWKRDLSRATLYGSMIARAREASEYGRIAGLLWYEGEADVGLPGIENTWPGDFSDFVANVRKDLDVPGLPVVMTVLGPTKSDLSLDAWASFQDMQRNMRLPAGVARVSASDLEVADQDVHLTTPSYLTLGQRYAEAMMKLLRGVPSQTTQ